MNRPFAIFLTVAALGAAAPADAAQTADGEPPRTENGLRTDLWTAPDDATGELSLYLATQAWETTYGGRDPSFTFGVTGGFNVLSFLELQGVVDFSVRRESPGNLAVTNTATFLGAGPALGFWLGFVRLHVEGAGGGVMRTLGYSGDVDVPGAGARFSPAWQVGGGAGLGIFGTFGLGVRALGRFHDDRSNVLFTLEGSWFFGGS